LFTLAERHAQGDPIDIAAIIACAIAVVHRVNSTISGFARPRLGAHPIGRCADRRSHLIARSI